MLINIIFYSLALSVYVHGDCGFFDKNFFNATITHTENATLSTE